MLNDSKFIGFLTATPVLKTYRNKPCAKVTLAVPRDYKVKDNNGKVIYPADFIPCVICNFKGIKDMQKGRKICASGRLETASYENEDGTKKYSFCLVVQKWYFLDPNPQIQNKKKEEST